MLNKLKEIKIALMKQRHDIKERLNNPSVTPKQTDTKLKHELTLQINGINTVLTEMKNFAVKNKLANESKLIIDDQVKVLNLVLKQLDKEAEAYTSDHPKAKDAIINQSLFLEIKNLTALSNLSTNPKNYLNENLYQGFITKSKLKESHTSMTAIMAKQINREIEALKNPLTLT